MTQENVGTCWKPEFSVFALTGRLLLLGAMEHAFLSLVLN